MPRHSTPRPHGTSPAAANATPGSGVTRWRSRSRPFDRVAIPTEPSDDELVAASGRDHSELPQCATDRAVAASREALIATEDAGTVDCPTELPDGSGLTPLPTEVVGFQVSDPPAGRSGHQQLLYTD